MKFASLAAALLAIPAALGETVSVSFDQVYDNGANSLDIVACSDGSNGLINKGQRHPQRLPVTEAHPPTTRRLHDIRLAPALPQHRRRTRCDAVQLRRVRDVLAAYV